MLSALTAAVSGVSPWKWHAHLDVWALMLTIGGVYLFAVRNIGPRLVKPGQPVVTRRQVVHFSLGLVALWAHADWPIHDIAEQYLFSAHMFQHIGFTLVAAPLLLLGTPEWMMNWLLGRGTRRAIFSRLARPLAAGLFFNAVVVFTHWPVIVNASVTSEWSHFALHSLAVSSALLMWFPIINRIRDLPTMSPPGRMLYLFLQSVIPTVPAAFLTFGDGVIYRFYADVPRITSMSAVEDQQFAGALMKIYAGLLLWGVIVVMFFRWYAEDSRDKTADVLTWDDVERELARTAPPPSG